MQTEEQKTGEAWERGYIVVHEHVSANMLWDGICYWMLWSSQSLCGSWVSGGGVGHYTVLVRLIMHFFSQLW